MAIMKWLAEADTTITNSFKEGLSKKGTNANMGLADALEVFCLHGQVASSGTDSKEIARILIRFDIEALRNSLVAEDVPHPGKTNKPKYYLRMFNAPHPETLPNNFTLHVHKINSEFDEGTGLDMSEYTDSGAASWLYRKNTPASPAATGRITVSSSPTAGEIFSVRIGDETISVTAAATPALTASAIYTAIEGVGGSSKVTATDPSGGTAVVLTSDSLGSIGNYRYFVTSSTGGFVTPNSYMTGGLDFTAWATSMGINTGDFTGTGSILASDAIGTQLFNSEEDMIIDITTYLQDVIYDGSALRTLEEMKARHYGLLIKIKDETEKSSKYTKKFFARSSEFFFKRPCIEARWDSSIKDNRANFFTKSALLDDSTQNTQNVFLYNSVNGVKSNFTAPAGTSLFVRFYTDSTYSTLATLSPAADFRPTSSVSTGVYSASVIINDSTLTKVYDKWYYAAAGGSDTSTWTVAHTGSFDVSQRSSMTSEKKERYILSVTNLKKSYSREEKPRFRLYSRLKDWSPTIYTVASKSLENKVIDKVYYKIFRVVDDEVIVDYGIGSTGTNSEHSLLSYDSEGNYFDFDMSLLESGYMYGIKFMTSINGELKEQREVFKFRVD